MKHVYFILLGICLSCLKSFGQQQVQTGLYMFNSLAINPAYAGSHGAFSAVMNYRNQGVGVNGAPTNMIFAMHTPALSKHIGIGLSAYRYTIGATKTTGFYADFMYRIRINKDSKKRSWLAMGLRGGLDFFRADLSDLRVLQEADVYLAQQVRKTLPNVGAGVYYYSKLYYVGLSTPNLLQNMSYRLGAFHLIPHYNIMGGAVIPINKTIDFKPSMNIIMVKNAPISIDFNANLLFNDRLWVGAVYRISGAGGLNMTVSVNDMLQIGYAYVQNFTMLRQYSPGTHELVLVFDVKKPKVQIRSRYF